MTLFKKCGHISNSIASITANVLISRREELSYKNLKQHQRGNVVSSKDLDSGGKLKQPEKGKSLKKQDKKQDSSIICKLLTL